MEEPDLTAILKKLTVIGRQLTPQRRACYAHFFSLDTLLDAESLWIQLRADGIVMSRDTVNSALRLLVKTGFAERRLNPLTSLHEFKPIK